LSSSENVDCLFWRFNKSRNAETDPIARQIAITITMMVINMLKLVSIVII
jgi:hypothetical protein